MNLSVSIRKVVTTNFKILRTGASARKTPSTNGIYPLSTLFKPKISLKSLAKSKTCRASEIFDP